MKVLPSSEFRNQYHRLTEPTQVEALGRIIGQWLPTKVTIAERPEQYQEFTPVPKPLRAKRSKK